MPRADTHLHHNVCWSMPHRKVIKSNEQYWLCNLRLYSYYRNSIPMLLLISTSDYIAVYG